MTRPVVRQQVKPICCNVEAGGKAPVSASAASNVDDSPAGTVVFAQNFDTDFKLGPLPRNLNLTGGSWRTFNSLGGGIVAEGVNNSNCLKVVRDGGGGAGILHMDKRLSDDRSFRVSFKVKLSPGNGVALHFVRSGKGVVGGLLLYADQDAKAYAAMDKWDSCATSYQLPADEFVECRVDFDAAQKQYTVTFIDRDNQPHTAVKSHPYLVPYAVDEVRFLNILPQQCHSLIDDVEVSLL